MSTQIRRVQKLRSIQRRQQRQAKVLALTTASQGWQHMIADGVEVETGTYRSWLKVEAA